MARYLLHPFRTEQSKTLCELSYVVFAMSCAHTVCKKCETHEILLQSWNFNNWSQDTMPNLKPVFPQPGASFLVAWTQKDIEVQQNSISQLSLGRKSADSGYHQLTEQRKESIASFSVSLTCLNNIWPAILQIWFLVCFWTAFAFEPITAATLTSDLAHRTWMLLRDHGFAWIVLDCYSIAG